MEQYVSQMASIFDGFRLDNAHSTPIHVCQHLLQVARTHNKHLFVMAELFTPSVKIDVQFAKRLNLNGMIREI
jgi:glycogen debranching enzyme